MKRILCLIAIGLLTMLIFVPPYLRRHANFLVESVSTKGSNDKVSMLNCKRGEDSINTSYLNSEPYNIQYKISGDYTNSTWQTEEENAINNSFITDLESLAKIKYNAKKNITTYKIEVSNLNDKTNLKNYLLPINEEQLFYQNIGFVCSMQTL